jgi:polysaccharide export outer membrane protein
MHMFRGFLAVAGFVLLISSSFAATPPKTTSFTPVPNGPEFNAVAPAVPVPPSEYKIGPQDTLIVDVFQVPDLSRTVQVDGKGSILLPLIGVVSVGGQTPQQVADGIRDELGKNYMKDPQVTVTVKESASQKVTVDGAVVQPGIYPIQSTTTLSQAIALARGPDTALADISHVAIFRNSGPQRTAAVFNLSDIRSGKMTDPQVVANDIIVVETSGTRRFLRDLANISGFLNIFRPY